MVESATLSEKDIKEYKYSLEMYYKNKIKAENCPELDFLKNDRYKNF